MNKAQKIACFNLTYSLLGMALGVGVYLSIDFRQSRILALLNRVWLLLFMIMPPLSYFYLRKKQSSSEVDFDERARQLK